MKTVSNIAKTLRVRRIIGGSAVEQTSGTVVGIEPCLYECSYARYYVARFRPEQMGTGVVAVKPCERVIYRIDRDDKLEDYDGRYWTGCSANWEAVEI